MRLANIQFAQKASRSLVSSQVDLLQWQRGVLGNSHPDSMNSMFRLSLWRYNRGLASQRQDLVAEGRALADELMSLNLDSLPSDVAAQLKARHLQLHSAVWPAGPPVAAGGSAAS